MLRVRYPTAILLRKLWLADRDGLAAFVVATLRTDAMRQARRVAVRTLCQGRRICRVVAASRALL